MSIEQELQRGWQIHQAKRFAEAEAIYRQALAKAPQHAAGWCYLGISLHDQRKYQPAVDAYRKALELNPKFPIALNNMGNSLRYVHQFEEADQSFQKAIDLKPDYLNAHKNRGTLHVWTGDTERGMVHYQEALKIQPNDAELHRNLGVIHLLQGNFEKGWEEYRWRWKVGDLHRFQVDAPVWQGESLAGKSILLTAEQGLGDTLNFARYASTLQDMGAQTTIYCQPPLMALLQSSQLGRVYPNSLAPEGQFDFHCSLLDVADVLRCDASNIPSNVPYLHPSSQLVEYWKGRPVGDVNKMRVGIAWQGNPDHQADVFRSIPLKAFEPLASMEDVQLVSLQAGFGSEQIEQWQGGSPLVRLDPNVDQSSGAFMDTAAIMLTSLDLVITSDTSIAHLAGALGVPTWIALGYVPDWRWLLDRDDSPWYPTARLFRQTEIGKWGDVFDRIADELRMLSADR